MERILPLPLSSCRAQRTHRQCYIIEGKTRFILSSRYAIGREISDQCSVACFIMNESIVKLHQLNQGQSENAVICS